jgi:hypothetical protein
MFRATFLGNHGWLCASEGSTLLVDPLLRHRFGWTDRVGLHVWPPRDLALDRFPAVDAVLLTHEHEGHFDIASLHLLDRAIPIYIPSLSSLAMRDALSEMGFRVHLLVPGERFDAGDLEVHTLPSDQLRSLTEEWDNLAHVVRDRGGHGSLFTPVDMAPTQAMRRAAERVLSGPGLWAHPNNVTSVAFQHRGMAHDRRAIGQLVKNVMGYHQRLSQEWAVPAALLLYGAGFCFSGDRGWLNQEMFSCESRDVARLLQLMLPGEKVFAPLPGDTYAMRAGKLAGVERAPYLGPLPPSEWPPRECRGEVAWLDDFDPACGVRELAPADQPALEEELAGFAAFLYANYPFRRLYSLRKEELAGRRPTFALVLRTGRASGPLVLAYEPQACRFAWVESADPAAEYLETYECWATDLLALLRGEIASGSLALARSRHQSAVEELFDLDTLLMQYAHPLRQPDRFRALYRRVIGAQGPAAPAIRAAERP